MKTVNIVWLLLDVNLITVSIERRIELAAILGYFWPEDLSILRV